MKVAVIILTSLLFPIVVLWAICTIWPGAVR